MAISPKRYISDLTNFKKNFGKSNMMKSTEPRQHFRREFHEGLTPIKSYIKVLHSFRLLSLEMLHRSVEIEKLDYRKKATS